jgi:NCAIR mutase (PurE)-related protein
MNPEKIRHVLEAIQAGSVSIDDALEQFKRLPFEELGYAKVDHHRALRTGFPEVIFAQGKTEDQVIGIYKKLAENEPNVLITRASPTLFDALHATDNRLHYNALAKTIRLEDKPRERKGLVLVISAGTADLPVAEEAVETASLCGSEVEKIYDAGVAGIHRLLAHVDRIQQARCIVTVAGMEGALPSVVGGLASCPVIAVPTSVGYGAHLQGLAPLLTMLNACSSNITVVNIDNGFGAGFNASLINQMPAIERE